MGIQTALPSGRVGTTSHQSHEMVSTTIQLVAEHLLLLGSRHQLGPERLLLLASPDSLLGNQQVLGAEHLFLLAPSFLEPCLGSGLWPGTWLDRLALVISLGVASATHRMAAEAAQGYRLGRVSADRLPRSRPRRQQACAEIHRDAAGDDEVVGRVRSATAVVDASAIARALHR